MKVIMTAMFEGCAANMHVNGSNNSQAFRRITTPVSVKVYTLTARDMSGDGGLHGITNKYQKPFCVFQTLQCETNTRCTN